MSVRVPSFEALLRKHAKDQPQQIRKGLRSGVRRGKALLVKLTPVYVGEMKNSWNDREKRTGAQLTNDAPYAGVVERGARPHGISPEGMAAITQWFERQRGLDPEAAKAAAWGYAARVRKYGQPGEFIVEKALDELRSLAQREIERLIFAGSKP